MFFKTEIFLVIFFSISISFAQNRILQFSHLNTQDGLSANTVFCILQDQRGFLWVGTYDGLTKYDGYKFTVYKSIEGNSSSISDNKIRAFCEDKEGNLWIGTWYNGLNKYDQKTEKFTRYLHDENDPSSINSNSIIALYIDNSGKLFIGTGGGGLNIFDPEKQKFHRYINNPEDSTSLSDNAIYTIFEDQNAALWLGTGKGGLNKFDKLKGTFTYFKYNPSDYESISSNWVLSLLEDHSGNFWIGTGTNGLNKFDRTNNKFFRYSKDPNNSSAICSNMIWAIHEDSEGILWLGTDDGGLAIFNRTKEEFSCYRKNYEDPSGLNDDAVISIYEDRSGILWFGTWNGGLNIYNKRKNKFSTYSHNPRNNNSLSGNSIYAIYKDSFGDVWVGTDINGLNRINEKNNYQHYIHNPGDPFSISSNSINSICEDGTGNLWIGTDGGGLNKFDRSTDKFIHFKYNPNDLAKSISGNKISQIYMDSNGDLWIGVANGGLNKLPKAGEDFIHYSHNPGNPKSISPQTIFAFNEDDSGNLWIGTNGGGLNIFNKKSEEFIHYKYESKDPSSLSNNEVSVIHKDKYGTIWIGTNGGGINKFDSQYKIFKRYSEKDGLPNNMICGILEDNDGNLWISTYKGLSKFNPKTERFRNFGVEEGLQGNEFNNWAYFKGKDGKMYFGGTSGLNVFHPDSLKDNSFIPPVVITDFQLLHKPVTIGYDTLWDRTILEKAIFETSTLELNHYDNIISFEFSALDFQNPERNLYSYILEGFDKEWTYTDAAKRYVTYTNLDPGEYIFRVKGSNCDGIWNESGTSLSIIIQPPWWATWWSYTLYSLLFVFAFMSSTRFYLNRKRLRLQLNLEHEHAKKLEEIDQMKSSFYANISHEFRTPLMLILGPAEKIITKVADDDLKKQAALVKSNANRMLILINQLLDLSRIEAGKVILKASQGNIAQFVKGITMEFESIAERKDITLNISFEKEKILAYFDREKMEKIITNILSNAFKFTPEGGTIKVSMNQTDNNFVEIIVKDTGIGIPKNELLKIFDRFYQVDGSHTKEYEGTGIGLALTKELVGIHQGKIFIDSEEGKWTEVKLIFALGKNHLLEEELIESPDLEEHKIQPVEGEYGQTVLTDEDSYAEQLADKTIVLVVEDNADLREFMRDALQENYHVEVASNGEQGLRKAEKLIPDLIVSDIMMPRMDGREMTTKIKQDEKTSHIPVILLTAKSDQESKLEGFALGADDYLIKPFDTKELLARIKSLIDIRKFLQEKFSTGAFIKSRKEKPKLSAIDEKFMNRIMTVIEEHLSEENFSIEEFGRDVGMSRSQIHRKLKALTGKSASVYLRSVRLARAKQMIDDKKATISEISYMVGFSSPAYFSRCFKEEFGAPPSGHSS